MPYLILAFILHVLVPVLNLQDPPALIVTIQDAAGSGLTGIEVLVRDQTGQTDLVRAVTDDLGVAQIDALPTQTVRIVVRGSMATGVTLHQRGADAKGVLVHLASIPTKVALRVASDGSVAPDPATMITPDLGIPIDMQPLQANPFPLPIATPQPMVPQPIAPPSRTTMAMPILLTIIGVIAFCAIGLIAFIRSVKP